MNDSYDTKKIMFIWLKILGLGFLIIVGYINIDSYFTSKEFPNLNIDHPLDNERILSVKKERGIAYVEFQSGRKHKLSYGANLNYENDYQRIDKIVSIGDLVSKRTNSDTIKIRHLDKDYIFVLGHTIKKN